jgi:hypothetical protein
METNRTAEVVPLANAAGGPAFLNLNECDGMLVMPSWPRGTIPANPPPEWNETAWPLIALPTEVYECSRFSLGPFERADVRFAIQTHDNRETPPACADGVGKDFSYTEIIEVIIVDDPEIAEYLQALGLPAHHGTIDSSMEQQGDAAVGTWTVHPDGYSASELQVVIVEEPNRREGQTFRRFWVNPTGGVSFVDMRISMLYGGTSIKPVAGFLEYPFIHPDGASALVYSGTYFLDSYAGGPISHFGDLQCNEPLSSYPF